MRIPKQIPLPALQPLTGKIQPSLMKFLAALYRALQQYNVSVQETIAGNTKSGVAVMDDGTTRVTLTFTEGKLTGATQADSTSAEVTWTDA